MQVPHFGASTLVVAALLVCPQEQGLSARIRTLAAAALDGDLNGLSIAIDVGGETFLAQRWGETRSWIPGRRHLGAYYIGCNEYVIYESSGHLALRTPFDRDYALLYQGLHTFLASEDPEIRLTFEIEDDAVVAFQLEEHGATSRAKRIR